MRMRREGEDFRSPGLRLVYTASVGEGVRCCTLAARILRCELHGPQVHARLHSLPRRIHVGLVPFPVLSLLVPSFPSPSCPFLSFPLLLLSSPVHSSPSSNPRPHPSIRVSHNKHKSKGLSKACVCSVFFLFANSSGPFA